MMDQKDRFLLAILVVLSLSVLVTGGLAVYLTLTREYEVGDGVAGGQTGEDHATVDSTAAATATTSGPRIAFVSDREGDVAVYVMDTDGSHLQRVSTPDLGFCFYPSWSPDGQRVAYVGVEGDLAAEDSTDVGIWISAADGSEHVHISHAVSGMSEIPPTWSPDGTLLAFAVEGEPAEGNSPGSTIHIARADGSGIERNISLPWTINHLTWSPVKDELLLVSNMPSTRMSAHVLSSDGEEITEVFRGALAADWSPDGEAVVVGGYASQEIIIIDIGQDDQDQTPRTVAQVTMQPVQVAWSPDSTYIAVATAGHYRQGYATILHIVTLETGEITTVVEGEGWLAWPHWSPDSHHLLFTWGKMSRRENLPFADLWGYDVASGEREQLTMGEGFEGLGVWSP